MLNTLPPIFCLTDSQNKREYMEDQFNFYGVEKYQFLEKKYKIEEFDNWKNLILDEKIYSTEYELSRSINLIETIVNWFDSNQSEICIIMEDNVDLSPSQHWIFD